MEKLIVVVVSLIAGCATNASLTVHSQPEGAYISEVGTGTSFGIAPATFWYAPKGFTKQPDGCYLVRGFEARWVSGAATTVPMIKLCRGVTDEYNFTINRDPKLPGFDKDMQFALQLQSLRAQQQQAQAAQNAAAAALFSAWQSAQPVNCTSTANGNQVLTNCR